MASIKVALLDNNDSFTHTIAAYLRDIAACELRVIPSEHLRINDLNRYDKLVISPGPGQPHDFPILFDVIEKYHQHKPILGICLGHQAIAEYFGANLINIQPVVHGQPQQVRILKPSPIYRGLPDSFTVGLYHSWIVDRAGFPAELEITAELENGRIMSFAGKNDLLYGVQFHPESYMTEYGFTLLENFVKRL
ncbi:MAG: aminodeoxychorismate/anthranilate synthase component II [Calditrichales bacterium]|nr:MAG: aminodeoxychorismate/anthranilate synthase component II [Calditrichales bacterium]